MEELPKDIIIKYSIDEYIHKSSQTITSIYEKYKNDDWMIQKSILILILNFLL